MRADEPRGPGGKPLRQQRPHRSKVPPGEVRLIGGRLKRSKLPVPDHPGLRPTPDRVRETLFNWLGQDLSGWRVLDAYAGSGALGFEAASRGAAVLLLEQDSGLVASLLASAQRLGTPELRVQRTDALRWMATAEAASFELVLLDPPFEAGQLAPAITVAAPLVAPGGFLYVESPGLPGEPPAGLQAWRSLKAGAVHAQLWHRT
jgi:16S rRNA (guanine(966)-N(2))-methyltransferase RsmD